MRRTDALARRSPPRTLERGTIMTTADSVREHALALARTSVDRDEAVRELEALCEGRRVAVVRARQQMLSSADGSKNPPPVAPWSSSMSCSAGCRPRGCDGYPRSIAGTHDSEQAGRERRASARRRRVCVMTLGILEIGGVFNIVVGLAGAWTGCLLMFVGRREAGVDDVAEFRRQLDEL
jgi:hypothetical protein